MKKHISIVFLVILSFFCESCKRKIPVNLIEDSLQESIAKYYSDSLYDGSKNNSYLIVTEHDTITGYRLFRLYDSFLNIKDPSVLEFYRRVKKIKVLFKVKEFNYNDSILQKHIIAHEDGLFYNPIEWLIIMNNDYEIISIINDSGYMPLDSLMKEYPNEFKKIIKSKASPQLSVE